MQECEFRCWQCASGCLLQQIPQHTTPRRGWCSLPAFHDESEPNLGPNFVAACNSAPLVCRSRVEAGLSTFGLRLLGSVSFFHPFLFFFGDKKAPPLRLPKPGCGPQAPPPSLSEMVGWGVGGVGLGGWGVVWGWRRVGLGLV